MYNASFTYVFETEKLAILLESNYEFKKFNENRNTMDNI